MNRVNLDPQADVLLVIAVDVVLALAVVHARQVAKVLELFLDLEADVTLVTEGARDQRAFGEVQLGGAAGALQADGDFELADGEIGIFRHVSELHVLQDRGVRAG